jgi:hypothetical protein
MAGVLLACCALPCRAGTNGNETKSSESPSRPQIRRTADIWTLPSVTEIAARTPRPQAREFEPERWQRDLDSVFFLYSANNSWQLTPAGSRRAVATTDTNLMELRWKLAAAHRSIPTFELAGCDVISARDFYPPARLVVASTDANHGRLQRARQVVSSKIGEMVRSGCE